jgi:2-keto-4-pentenoate hydratase/2-oxohepta-3-ene-1,7-dioic acid hydratase in catechol pathway
LDDAKAAAASGEASIDQDDVELLPPVVGAEKYFCIGVNYANRNAEYKDGSEAPKNPSVFMRSSESFVGDGQFIERPPESDQLDYEGELVIIIGKEGRRISRENARDHIAGMCLMNEGTLRDWVRHAKFNVTQGKNFERSGSLGPYMITMDEIGDLTDMDIQTRVNGELRQDDNTSSMMFPIDFQVEYLSKFARLKPGDIIATGTPNGAGARFDPPKYLVPGDVVEVSSPSIGVLRNEVKDEIV